MNQIWILFQCVYLSIYLYDMMIGDEWKVYFSKKISYSMCWWFNDDDDDYDDYDDHHRIIESITYRFFFHKNRNIMTILKR